MRAGVVGVAMLLAASASGGIEHTILHGVSVHDVRTWVGPDAIPGITEAGLKAETERSLKQAGIVLDPKGSAELFLHATAILHEGNCFVTIEGRLLEPAKLDRNGFIVEASSWQTGGTVIVKTPDCAGSTQKVVQSVVRDFVEHYQAMNPTRVSTR